MSEASLTWGSTGAVSAYQLDQKMKQRKPMGGGALHSIWWQLAIAGNEKGTVSLTVPAESLGMALLGSKAFLVKSVFQF